LWIDFLKDSKLPLDASLLTNGKVVSTFSAADEKPLPTLVLLQVSSSSLSLSLLDHHIVSIRLLGIAWSWQICIGCGSCFSFEEKSQHQSRTSCSSNN
jgi:hypothetical protein